MNVVGKVGNLITQGVYSVATPFHPFGGAVDIIVVQQQDGSFRSTPWYVQFGKFQGVLKGAEKVVRINVNGVEANFHMYLDNSGEAYFIREADSGQDSEKIRDEREAALEHSFSVDNSQCNIIEDNVENFRLQSTMSDPGILRDEFSSFSKSRLERTDSDACRFYDFQDDQSFEGSVELSSDFGSSRYENMESVETFVEAQGSDSEVVLVSVDGHILTAPISSSEQNTENVQLVTPQFHLGPGKGNGFCETDREFTVSGDAWDSEYLDDLDASSSKHSSTNAARENNLTPPCEGSNIIQEELAHQNSNELDSCLPGWKSDIEGEELKLNQQESEECDGILDEGRQCDELCKRSSCTEGRALEHQYDEAEGISKEQVDADVTSDMEDSSPCSKNGDKFRSCLDLTSVATVETLESEDSPPRAHEALRELREEDLRTEKISFGNEMVKSPEMSHRDAEVVGNAHVGGLSKNQTNDGSTPSSSGFGMNFPVPTPVNLTLAMSPDGRDASDPLHKSVAYTMVCGLNHLSPIETAKHSFESYVSDSASSGSGVAEPQAQSLSGGRPSNLTSVFEISLCANLLRPGMGLSAAAEVFNIHRISEEEFKKIAGSIVKNENLVIRYREKYLPWNKAAPMVLGKAAFDLDLPVDSKYSIPVEQELTEKVGENESGGSLGRRWRLWPIPFRRVMTLQHPVSNSSEEVFVDSESISRSPSLPQTPPYQTGTPKSDILKSPHKKIVRTNIPTTEQIASLNLKEGQNDVTLSFSTRVLGVQQVEAHIYLWKYNARIVISDVDGTITKSDVLGQFMPLVGKDWSQSGVARLFSAIKENGYQLLFLSARAIVQAYLTKSFLFNLKQDGKTLPNGPVVISPDGLFPSLFREVIRRAPHEFKIACLEDIKALFPPDYNPFYAGFGNRDTDELTYRKIGIPKGKIFIINPKGEVAINHRIDVKSYTSLHTLVNDMFPPTSMVEQEDYNAWNYWRMPLPDIGD